MHITLSDEARAWAEQQIARAGYKTIDEYLEALIRRDREQSANWLDELVDAQFLPGTGNEVERTEVRQALHDRVVTLLDEAVASGPPTPMTAQDWAALRQQVESRLGKQNGPS